MSDKVNITISKELLEDLEKLKINNEDTYEDVIIDLLENRMKLSEETKKYIKKSEDDIKNGRLKTLAEVEERIDNGL